MLNCKHLGNSQREMKKRGPSSLQLLLHLSITQILSLSPQRNKNYWKGLHMLLLKSLNKSRKDQKREGRKGMRSNKVAHLTLGQLQIKTTKKKL